MTHAQDLKSEKDARKKRKNILKVQKEKKKRLSIYKSITSKNNSQK